MKKASMKRRIVWAYCRVSTLKAEQELSLEQQIAWARDVAKQRGAELVTYSERASAKTITHRPECVRLINDLEAAKPSERPEALIATSFDRLSRDITDTLILARALKLASVELYVRDRGTVPMSSFADQAALVGQAMGGHAENDARSARARASWERRRLEGKPTSNKVPYGLQLRGERDVAAQDSAKWVLKIFQWYASGLGMPAIAKRCQSGAPPHRVSTSRVGADGKPIVRERAHVWEPNKVRKILGQFRYRDTIVPAKLFDEVQQRIVDAPRYSNVRKSEYPLSGAIKCAGCGRSFHGHATGGTKKKKLADGRIVTYPNAKKTRSYVCTVCNTYINAEEFEGWFRGHLKKFAVHPTLLRSWLDELLRAPKETPASEIRSAERDLERIVAKKQRAWNLALEGDSVVMLELPDQLRRINEEESRVRDRLAGLNHNTEVLMVHKRTEKALTAMLRNFWSLFDAATYEEKRRMTADVVQGLGGAVASPEGITWLKRSPRAL